MRFVTALALILAALLGGGCKEGETAVDKATREGILLLGNGDEPKALDPHLVSSVGDSNIMRALFEGLVAYHPSEDSTHAPGVAERWESNEDASEWTFYLRDDAKWSNGDPVTAGDFVYAYKRILHPDIGSPYASMLHLLKNGEQFNRAEIGDFAQVGVKAPDPHTLVCTLKEPALYFPDLVKHTTWLPVHQPTIEKFGSMTDQFTLWQRPGNHVGNGPFKLKSWRINGAVKVVPNPHYWDRETVKLNGIVFYPVANNFTEERAFRDGLLHKTYIIPPDLIEFHKANNPELTKLDPYAGVYFYRCNVTKPPLDNKSLRRALAFAVDRETIVKYVSLAGEQPAHGVVPPTEGGYQPFDGVRFDLEKAKAYLKEAGYDSGADVPEFQILINTSESHKAIAAAVQDMWKKHLGIEKVTIGNQEWKVYQTTLREMRYQCARSGWIGDYIDPSTFLTMWRTGDDNNQTGWGNPDFDRLLTEAAHQTDPEKRFAKFQEAEAILLDELPLIPIYWYTQKYLLDPAVEGWHPLLLDNHPFKHVRLNPAKSGGKR